MSTPIKPTKTADTVKSPRQAVENIFRVPKPELTSTSDDVNDAAAALYSNTCELFRACLEDGTHVGACLTKVCERKRKRLESLSTSGDGTLFKKKYTTLGKLVEAEPDWIIDYLVSVSDLKSVEWLMALSKEPLVLQMMLQLDTQLAMSLRLTQDMQISEVLRRYFGLLSTRFGSRLATLKKDTKYDKVTGLFDMRVINFRLSFTGEKLTSVVHTPTNAEAKITAGGIDKSFDMRFPFSDFTACLIKEPLAPTKVALSFFPRKDGPNKEVNPTKASQVALDMENVVTAWKASFLAANAGKVHTTSVGAAKKQMVEKAKVDNKDKMDSLLVKAKAAMKKKLAGQTVKSH
jgi:hypothetical protein